MPTAKIMRDDWRRQSFLNWLCTPPNQRDPTTQKALAEKLGLNEAMLTRWKSDLTFIADWETEYRKAVGSPEKAQEVIERLHETAVDRTDPRQVPAAKAYLEAIDAIKPRKMELTVTKGAAKDLTDEQLYAILAERVERELQERSDA